MHSMFYADYNLFINCGGNRVEVGRDEYEEDTSQQGSSMFGTSASGKWAYSSTGDFIGNVNPKYITTNVSVLNMTNPELYMTARLTPLSLKYFGLCLQNGNYTVKLHFAEIMFTENKTYTDNGVRIFDVYIQVRLWIYQNFMVIISLSFPVHFTMECKMFSNSKHA